MVSRFSHELGPDNRFLFNNGIYPNFHDNVQMADWWFLKFLAFLATYDEQLWRHISSDPSTRNKFVINNIIFPDSKTELKRFFRI